MPEGQPGSHDCTVDQTSQRSGSAGSPSNMTTVPSHKTQATADRPSDAMLLANIRDSVIATDLSGKVTYWNSGAERIFGYTAEEMLGHTLEVIYPSQDPEQLGADLERILAGEDYVGEWIGSRRDGTPVWLEITTTLLSEADGTLAGFLGVSHDITRRKQAEAELASTQARLRVLANADLIGIITADATSILTANDAFLRLVGYTREDLDAGRLRWHEMTPPEHAAADAQGIEEMLARGTSTPYEKEYFHKNGSRVPILIGAALLERDPLMWVCFVLDLSTRKRLEQERAGLLVREQAARQQLQRFLALVAHDLGQPLTGIRGNAQIIRRSRASQLAERDMTRLQSIEDATYRMQRLTEDLRDAASVGTGELAVLPEEMDLVASVHEIVAEQRAASETHRLVIDAPAQLLGMWDPHRIGQLLMNLVSNAIKYSPEGSTVLVRVDAGPEECLIRVEDQGSGLTPAQQDALFQPFSRPTGGNSSAGTGLGLYICKGIAEAHGGRIWVESEPGSGSAFCVALPPQSAFGTAALADPDSL